MILTVLFWSVQLLLLALLISLLRNDHQSWSHELLDFGIILALIIVVNTIKFWVRSRSKGPK